MSAARAILEYALPSLASQFYLGLQAAWQTRQNNVFRVELSKRSFFNACVTR